MVKLFSKNSNLCDHNSPTLQTDRQTDRQTDGRTDRRHAIAIKTFGLSALVLPLPHHPLRRRSLSAHFSVWPCWIALQNFSSFSWNSMGTHLYEILRKFGLLGAFDNAIGSTLKFIVWQWRVVVKHLMAVGGLGRAL